MPIPTIPTPPTRLDPLIQAVARKAENIYSKMAIRRDESQDLGKKKQGSGAEDLTPIPWEDTTDVSVVALRGFLEDLLGLAHTGTLNSDILPLPTPPTPQPNAPQTAASHAANAYRATGRVVHDENVEIFEPSPIIPDAPLQSDTDVRLGDDFGEEERETMRGYLRDLTELERRGVTFLTLQRSLTFLESIRQAIELAK